MIEQFHKARFFFNKDEQVKTLNIYHNIEIISNSNELYAKDGGGGFSLFLGNSYLSLDFDIESKRISNFGGVVNKKTLIEGQIVFPEEIVNGILYACEERGLIRGGSRRIEFAEKYIFDSKRSFFQIGDYVSNAPCGRFLKNAYCQLNSQGNLNCLLISDIKL